MEAALDDPHALAAAPATAVADAACQDHLGGRKTLTGEMIVADFVQKVNELFGEAIEGFRVLDEEDAALYQYLHEDVQKQQEKGRHLRAQIEKAQYSIKQFMRALPTNPAIEE